MIRHSQIYRFRLRHVGAVLAVLVAGQIATAAPGKTLAVAVAELRDRVESLAADLTFTRQERTRRAAAHGQAEAQLRADLAAETLRSERARHALVVATKDAPVEEGEHALRDALRETLVGLRASVVASIPFRQRERLAAVDELEAQCNAGVAEPLLVAQKVAALLEDEARLNQKSAAVKTEVAVDDEVFLVDAVRLGMMHLFFQTQDGRYGRADASVKHGQARWVTDQAAIAHIETMLADFAKGQKTGPVLLPLGGAS